MTNSELISTIKNIQNEKQLINCVLALYIKKHNVDLYNEVINRTSFLDKFSKVTFFERLYCLENNLNDRPKCKVCNDKYVSRFYPGKMQYNLWCSVSCSCKDKDTLQKSKQTRQQLYGSENYRGNDKARATRMQKNNGHYHSEDFVSKVKQTKLRLHGDCNYTNSEKYKATLKKRIENDPDFWKHRDEKTKQTKLKNGHDKNWNNRDKFKYTLSQFDDIKRQSILDKRQQTNQKKYGVKFANQCESVKEKTKNTNIKKYGVECVLNTEKSYANMLKSIRTKSWEIIQSNKEYIPLFTKDEFIQNKDKYYEWKWRCRTCGNEFLHEYYSPMYRFCRKCWPRIDSGTSKEEVEVCNYIKSLTNERIVFKEKLNRQFMHNSKEIDILIPSLKIGIEFDGLYWHSKNCEKDHNFHLKKTELCEKQGVQLVHVFEDEWLFKQKIVKARLKHLISKNQCKIFARKCIVREISSNIKDKFLEKYHIQGTSVSKINLGLYYKDYLVAVMTFSKSRFNKKYEYELSRYATIFNFTVVGGASKLLRYFERNWKPKSLLSYADRRWSKGNMYYKLGFTLDHISKPAYFYIKNQIRHSRIEFQKYKLKNLFENFDPKLSEVQNMANNGFSRIFDCGNLVFVKKY